MGTHPRLPSGMATREGWASYFALQQRAEPHLHQIEPTNHCPYACVMCPRPAKMSRPLGFLDLALYRKVMDEVAGYAESVRSREIELFHFGESLLHPDIDAMVAYAGDLGLNAVLSVNAPHLSLDLARRLLQAHPRRLVVSLDGFDAATYRAVRGPRAEFAVAMTHAESAARLFRDAGAADRFVVRMVRLHANERDVEAFTEHWRSLGIRAEIREFFPWGERDLANLGRYDRYPPNMPCPFPWQHVVMQWNGDVVPCCRDYNGCLVLGNARHQSLRDIWNGERYRAFREQHRRGIFNDNPTCADCSALYASVPPDANPPGWAGRERKYWMAHLQSDDRVARHLEATGARIDTREPTPIIARQPPGVGRDIPLDEDDLGSLWRRAAATHAGRTFLIDDADGSRFTYADADEVVCALANRLEAAGIGFRDHLALWTSQHTEAVLLFWASAARGVTVAVLDPDSPPEIVSATAARVAPALVFSDAHRFGRMDRPGIQLMADTADLRSDAASLSRWLRPEDRRPFTPLPPKTLAPAAGAILFTSGSEDKTKAVALAQHALCHSGRLMVHVYGWRQDDIILSTGELHTMSGLRNPAIATVHAGASAVIASPDVRSCAPALAGCVERHGVTVLTTVPAMLRQLVSASDRFDRQALGSLRMVLSTGSRLAAEARAAFEDRYGVPVYNYYGLTETAGLCAAEHPGEPRTTPESIGTEVDALFRLVQDDGRDARDGEAGELWVQSANLMIGYVGDPAATRAALQGRWHRTGDLVRREPDGHYTLLGRRTGFIKNSHGEIVSAPEIERELNAMPTVADACVLPSRSQVGDEILEAFVVPRAALTRDERAAWKLEVMRTLAGRLGRKRLPAELHVRERLFRGPSGKVRVEDLRRDSSHT